MPVNGCHHAVRRRFDVEPPAKAVCPEARCHPGFAATLAIGYDAWAPDYDADMARYGYRLPERMADEARSFIEARRAPLLDAGAGSGLMGAALKAAGYEHLVGLDPSPGMRRQAHAKGVYRRQLPMALGSAALRTAFRFEAALAAGVFKAGHAPPEALADLAQLVRPGGIVIFDVGLGAGAAAYNCFARRMAARRQWRLLRSTAPFPIFSGGAPETITMIHVFRTLSACCSDPQTHSYRNKEYAHGFCNPQAQAG